MMKIKFNKGLPAPVANGESIYKLSTRFTSCHREFKILQALKTPYPNTSKFEKEAARCKLPLKRLGLNNLKDLRAYMGKQGIDTKGED